LSEKKPHLNHDWLMKQLAIHGTASAVARVNGLNERAVQRQAAKLKQELPSPVANLMATLPHPVRPPDVMDELRISGNGLVSSDWHIPLISHDVAARMIDDAVRYDCTEFLVIAGDLFNFDALSQYAPKQDDAGLAVELEHATQILEIMLMAFDHIYITKGNHDNRFMQALGYKLRFEQTIKMCFPDMDRDLLDRITVTGNDYVIIESSEGPWYCCHTNQYSKTPLAVPRELCDIHQMHVAGAHRHHHAIGRNKGGQHWAVDLGGLFDASKTAYLRQYTTTFPRWTPGYMLLQDGKPYLPLLAPAPSVVTA
jgi:hypothetical protein